MIDAHELNRLLNDRLPEVCAYLFPNGKVRGGEFVVGGMDGSAGESLQITLGGSRAGRFKDFANPEDKGGTALWLWKQARKLSFVDAIKESKEWLGVKEEEFGIHRHKNKEWTRPTRDSVRLAEPNTKVMDYLCCERKLDPIVLATAKVCETENGEEVVLPFYEFDDESKKWVVVHRKYVKVDRPTGKKEIHATKGTKRCLYGKNLISDDIRDLVIAEGEFDALSWNSWGIPAVSIPNGVSDFEWVDVDWDWLTRFERIYVSTDMDDPGKTCAQEICKRLGLHRCYIVSLPKKDANECLVSGMKFADMAKLLASAKQIELDEIKRPGEYTAEVMDYYNTTWETRGWDTPWYPALPWRVRQAEFSILSGFSGSGKALALDTPIPTPTGWSDMGSLMPGDKVFDENGKPCKVVFATPVQYDRKCYSVEFSDGTKIIADADHLWETWTPHARNSAARSKTRVRKTKNLSQMARSIKPSVVTTEEISKTLIEDRWASRGRHKHGIPVAKALAIDDVSVPVDPYCLGAWIGDGSSYNAVVFCGNGDEQIIQQFSDAGFTVNKQNLMREGSCPAYGIGGLMPGLRDAGVIGKKHIPEWYLRSSINQRLSLLQGLMDTDGFIGSNGQCEFTSMLPGLASGVRELILSLGMRCTVTTGIASVNGKKCGTKYRIHFSPSMPVFRLQRKLDRMKPKIGSSAMYRYIVSVIPVDSVPVRCIQVDSPSHLYLCSTAMIPTHNTVALNQLMLHLVSQGLKIMDASLEIKPGLTLYNMTRCALGKKVSPKEDIEGCVEWLNESMFFLDCIGTVNTKRLITAMEYARKRHGVNVIVIDSLFKCGMSSEDWGAQREFTDCLTTFCNNTGCHVILVAHSRKTSNGNELSVPTKSDVAGSSDITNGAFNVIIWWRNKLKKRKLDELRAEIIPNVEEIKKWEDEPDGKAVLDKQRFGEGEEAECKVWFHRDSTQFHTQPNQCLPYFRPKKPF
jgi:hypothetical protein